MICDRELNERLAREVGLLAGRLAEFLAASLAPADGWDDGAAAPSPFDRLARMLGLVPAERDLLLLAGLAEEHEGYDAVLRTLHPRGEPYPSAGLAAQFLCRDRDERQALRGLLESGNLVMAGALRVV